MQKSLLNISTPLLNKIQQKPVYIEQTLCLFTEFGADFLKQICLQVSWEKENP